MPVNERAPVKLSLPLEFQQDVFRELRDEDELVVIARGLGLLKIVTNLLHSYDAVGNNLILLLGAEERENGWIGESLAEHGVISAASACKGLVHITSDFKSVGAREEDYTKGGIISITSRILIVDFLSGLLDPTTVTGIVVLHAEKVVATSLEAFILRIYRQKNKTGFLKAFSDAPEPLTTGFTPLTKILSNLFLRRPSLWPRFHVTVAKSLEGKKKAEVIELEVAMTDSMKDIQNAVLECVELCIQELKKANAGIDMEDWNVDSALQKNFDTIIRRQLDPVWHRTSFRTRQIVRDLTILRNILQYILTSDSVSFNKYLDTVLAASSPPPGSTRQNQSPWLFLDAAHTIFETARRRVYTGKMTEAAPGQEVPETMQPVLEELPKWDILAGVLDEIEQDAYYNSNMMDDSNGTTLIMAGDQSSCRQIREYLQNMFIQVEDDEVNGETKDEILKPSATFMMRRKLRNYLAWKKDFSKVSASLFSETEKSINNSADQKAVQANKGRGPPNKRRRIRGGANAPGSGRNASGHYTNIAGDRDAHIASLMQELEPTEQEEGHKGEVALDSLDNMEEYYEFYEMKDLLVVHPYDGDMDDYVLEEVKPRYIIMYEPDPAFIRRIEVYRSSHTDRNVRVYFMYYGGSVEEQRYLSAVRREKDAFTKLIRERGTMTVTMTLDGKGVEDPQEHFLRTVNTRIAGGGRLAATAAPPRVVIDVREFRSSLPSLLHGRSMETIPTMLTVGDYVLTPEICIERKTVSDLIQSLNSGRLYNQAETMLHHYKNPFLLIEFGHNKSFTLEPFADLSLGGQSSIASLTPSASNDLQSKLVLLTITFPRLKIIWSSTPYQTAEIFEELKKNQAEPDPLQAVQIGLQQGEEAESQTFNQTPQDMLQAIPGVGPKVASKLILEVGNIQELSNMEEDEIEPMVGGEAARQIHRFFNKSVFDD